MKSFIFLLITAVISLKNLFTSNIYDVASIAFFVHTWFAPVAITLIAISIVIARQKIVKGKQIEKETGDSSSRKRAAVNSFALTLAITMVSVALVHYYFIGPWIAHSHGLFFAILAYCLHMGICQLSAAYVIKEQKKKIYTEA